MAYEVFVEKKNETFVKVYSEEPCVHQELYEFFKVKDPSYKPNRFSKYDGMVRLYDRNTGELPAGLFKTLLGRLKSYNLSFDNRFKNIREVDRQELQEWIDSLNLPFTLYDYQFELIYDAIRLRRLTGLADTGAGKSLVIYCVARFLYEFKGEPMLIMAPSIMLVSQILQDFISYGWKEAPELCQQIMEGKPKARRKPIIISTWQSLKDLDKDYFSEFTSVIVDEVHGAQAKVQYGILQKCVSAVDRLGLTGTLSGEELHALQIEGSFGPVKRYVDTQTLKDLGQASQTQVVMVHMKYSRLDRVRLSKLDYEGQLRYIMKHDGRQRAVASLVRGLSSKGENSLVIFERVEEGLYQFKQILEDMGLGSKLRVIEGSVKLETRDEIKQYTETDEGVILLATWGTLSTGVNIKKLHNLFLNSSTKKLIRLLQTVGRLLRIHETKDVAKIFDFVDDTRESLSSKGFFVEHAKERVVHYSSKKHPIKNLSVPLEDVDGVSKEDFESILKESVKRASKREST